MAFLRLILCFVILLGSGSVPVVRAAAEATPATLTKVRVQLRWFHQYQFAGFYAALEQGYFRKAGLDVELIEGRPDLDPAERDEVAKAVHRVVEKLLHAPTVRVKEFAEQGRGGSYARALHELFDLDPRDVSLVSAPVPLVLDPEEGP